MSMDFVLFLIFLDQKLSENIILRMQSGHSVMEHLHVFPDFLIFLVNSLVYVKLKPWLFLHLEWFSFDLDWKRIAFPTDSQQILNPFSCKNQSWNIFFIFSFHFLANFTEHTKLWSCCRDIYWNSSSSQESFSASFLTLLSNLFFFHFSERKLQTWAQT